MGESEKRGSFYLITGHARSGTGYMAALFRAFGYDVQHEICGEDGTSCATWATFEKDPPWSPRGTSRLEVTAERDVFLIHVLRHPLRAIEAIRHNELQSTAQPYREKYLAIPHGWKPWDRAALSYIGWAGLIQAQGPDLTVKVEQAASVLGGYFQALGREQVEPWPSTKYNTRTHPRESDKAILGRFKPDLQGLILAFCHRWGYEVKK